MDSRLSVLSPALANNPVVLRNALASVLLVVAVLALRFVAMRFVWRSGWLAPSAQLRWKVQARWLAILVVALGLIVVWAAELRSIALSFVAVGVALVIATKELLLCVLGGVVRASSGSFRVGDRVQVGNVSGEVIDIRPLTTTLMEIGAGHQRTGRTVVLPNALFLTATVINETLSDDFLLHAIAVPVPGHDDWQEARRHLLEAATEVCAPYLAHARADMDATARRNGLPPLPLDPSVVVRLPDHDHKELVLRFPTPARDRGANEQRILERFLERWRPRPEARPPASEPRRRPPVLPAGDGE